MLRQEKCKVVMKHTVIQVVVGWEVVDHSKSWLLFIVNSQQEFFLRHVLYLDLHLVTLLIYLLCTVVILKIA